MRVIHINTIYSVMVLRDSFILSLLYRLQLLMSLAAQLLSIVTVDKPAASSTKSTRGSITGALISVRDDEDWKRKARACEIHTRRELQRAISTVTKWPNTTVFNTRALIIIIIIIPMIIIIMNQAVDPGSCFYESLTSMTHSFLLCSPPPPPLPDDQRSTAGSREKAQQAASPPISDSR